ncbi:MAG: GNAT family N-acetyltransferase [Brevinema sp.]
MQKDGKIIRIRPVSTQDAAFILSLRTNPVLSRFISPTSSSLQDQINWIKNYLQHSYGVTQYYFIIEVKQNSIPVGTVRLYSINFEQKECTWGSFMIHPSRPKGATVEAIKLSLIIAKEIGLQKVILDVRKENKKAIRLYEFCGFQQYDETELDFFYFIDLNKENPCL